MDSTFLNYLEEIDDLLQSLPVSERKDVIKEIKSTFLSMQHEGLSTETIINQLGTPSEVSVGYLSEFIERNTSFSWHRILSTLAFYTTVGFSGVIIVPALSLIALTLLICSVITPVLGALIWLNDLLHWNLAFMERVGVSVLNNPPLEFVLCIVAGLLLYAVARISWKMLIAYCRKVTQSKQKLSI